MTGNNQKIILEYLIGKVQNSKITEPFRITSMEMHIFNLLFKEDIYYNKDKVDKDIIEDMDLLYDRAMMLNYNVWCSNFNNSINISLLDYFKEFEYLLDGIMEIKVSLNESIGNLEELQMLKQIIRGYI